MSQLPVTVGAPPPWRGVPSWVGSEGAGSAQFQPSLALPSGPLWPRKERPSENLQQQSPEQQPVEEAQRVSPGADGGVSLTEMSVIRAQHLKVDSVSVNTRRTNIHTMSSFSNIKLNKYLKFPVGCAIHSQGKGGWGQRSWRKLEHLRGGPPPPQHSPPLTPLPKASEHNRSSQGEP